MRILVTGARGKVGAATVATLGDAGHDVTATDLGRPSFEAGHDAVAYKQADLTDAGDAFAVVRGHDAVVHCAAIPEPTQNTPHTVFGNNLMATFNTLEAAVRCGVPRFVNLSSETVPGFFFPERPWLPDYVPVDEEHPIRPAGSVRDRQALRRAADGRRDPPLGHHLPVDPPVVGAVGGQLREQRRPVDARAGGVRGLLGLHRRLRPRRRDPARRGGAPRPGTRSSTSPRPTSPRTSRWRSSRAASTATTRRRSGRPTSRGRTGSRSPRRAGCSATTRSAPGATTSTTTAGCAPRRASAWSAARPACSADAGSPGG